MRSRLRRLERLAKDKRATEELGAVFSNGMARLRALVNDEPLPPPHSRSNGPQLAGSFLAGEHRIVGRDGKPIAGPIEDLSE